MEQDEFIGLSRKNKKSEFDSILRELNYVLKGNHSNIDFLTVTWSLKTTGCVSDDLLTRLLDISTSERFSKHEQIFKFLELIKDVFSTERVYIAFCTAGCGSLFKLFLLCRNREKVRFVGRVSVPHNKHSNERYRFIKTCVDNNCFEMDKRQKLSNLRSRAVEKIWEGRTQDECQKHLEEKVLIDLHCIQLYGVSDLQKRFDILHTMNETRTENLDRTSLELTYHSKMAVTYAKIGQQIEAEEHIRQTLVMCDRCLPCFATIMALNDVLYAYQELFFVNRSQDLLRKAKDFGQVMYHVMTCEDEEAVNQWKRIILLFTAMTYLNISHEFEMGDMTDVSMADVKQADVLISEVKKVASGIETRREMVLNLCQGRILEHDDIHFATAYAKKAYDLVDDGCIRETEKLNIENYVTLLHNRH